MNRRSFLYAMGGMTMISGASAAAAERTRYYTLQQFFLKQGSQVTRIHDFWSKGCLPALGKVHSGPVILLESLVAPHMPQYVAIVGYRSLAEIEKVQSALHAQPEFQKALAEWERDPEPPYEHYSTSLLEATDYSPEVKPLDPPPKTPRIFELRTYHSPTLRQLRALHERFAGPEIKIFHRVGVYPVLYTSTIYGANQPNLTYLIPFESLVAREKAWAAFSADPEWARVRKESIELHGQISSVIQIWLYRAVPYSPVR
ncbi:MAG: NIPSNAP family protein [Bryobacteraceae bacterium]